MLNLLNKMIETTGEKKLTPVLHISCLMTAKLIFWVFQLCAPVFKSHLCSDWFVPLKEALGVNEEYKDSYQLPNDATMDILVLKLSIFRKLSDILEMHGIDEMKEWCGYTYLLSNDGMLLEEKYTKMGSPKDLKTIHKLSVQDLAELIYHSDKWTESWCIKFAANILHSVIDECHKKNFRPDTWDSLSQVANKVNFTSYLREAKSE